jgi:outer membrane protein OmpA-like peptidoglycan-associated protein
MKPARVLAWTLVALLAWPAQAQFGDLLNSAKDRAAREAADAAYDTAKEGATSTAKSKGKKPAQAQPQEEPAEEDSPPPPPVKRAAPTAAAPESSAAAPAPPAGEVYGNRFDFVPGDKVLVYDDFSDTDVGEYPAKWTIKEGGGNAVEVVQVGSQRFMKSRYQPEGQQASLHWLRYNIKGDLPKNFTIEFDADLGGPTSVVFSHLHGHGGQQVWLNRWNEGRVETANANGNLPVKSGLRHVSIAVSGTQVKVYVAGERVVTDPDGIERPITRIGMYFEEPWREGADHQMFTNLRIAEGGKPAKQMLAGEGRIVTHGILFDTGSDVIKPESGPTLRSILQLLQEDPKLRFSIEGHTDNQGGAKVNGPLSERRAAAVKAWLVKQGIDAGRLSTKGLGDTKPIDSNATAEGRANNRRVEFVKT